MERRAGGRRGAINDETRGTELGEYGHVSRAHAVFCPICRERVRDRLEDVRRITDKTKQRNRILFLQAFTFVI